MSRPVFSDPEEQDGIFSQIEERPDARELLQKRQLGEELDASRELFERPLLNDRGEFRRHARDERDVDIINSLSQVLTNVARARQEPKFELKLFEGKSEENPAEFLNKYELLSDAYGWDNGLKCKYITLYLRGRALRWYLALPSSTK